MRAGLFQDGFREFLFLRGLGECRIGGGTGNVLDGDVFLIMLIMREHQGWMTLEATFGVFVRGVRVGELAKQGRFAEARLTHLTLWYTIHMI